MDGFINYLRTNDKQKEKELFTINKIKNQLRDIVGFIFIIIAGIFITIIPTYNYVLAANEVDLSKLNKINKLEEKVSKRFANKFCNSIGFGLSKDSSIKFAIGENRMELAENKLAKEIDIKEIEDKTAKSIIAKCGYAINQVGEEGTNEFSEYLQELEAFKP